MSNSSKRCLGSITGRGTAGSFPQFCSFPSPAENPSLKEKSSSYPTTQKSPILPQHTHCNLYITLRHDNTKIHTNDEQICAVTHQTHTRRMQTAVYLIFLNGFQLAVSQPHSPLQTNNTLHRRCERCASGWFQNWFPKLWRFRVSSSHLKNYSKWQQQQRQSSGNTCGNKILMSYDLVLQCRTTGLFFL